MRKAICDTSPLLYLHRLGALEWLSVLFDEIWVPTAVVAELREGKDKGYDVPDPVGYEWLRIMDPSALPSEWLARDLGRGELAVLALALENPSHLVVLDDALARSIARAAGMQVWGTLRILLEAKARGLTSSISPLLRTLEEAGMWISEDVRMRILAIAGESD
ncbi:MAG: hypothetical protein Kow00123_11280 [Anaerolineales bacterium]